MTIALSTSIPNPSASPVRVMRLRVRLKKYMSIRVMINEMGMAVEMTIVDLRLRRKMKRTAIANSTPKRAEEVTCDNESRII